ncbi:response regulator [Flavobacterium cyclinae]|uniref:response regulator n=1 Tax=Flavobacterium cyclinae TaxID=2895947 RepID=UPI001E2BA799|nr:response regulator [Flavobacterium cyclinae]UGS20545.1 response regulator [Flavobacterium cyclinae]
MNKTIKKIMIVDDNEFDCYITSKIINNIDESIDIMEFNSSTTAIQFLEEFQNTTDKLPDFIFLDIYMPVIDGFGFLDRFNDLSDVIKSHTKICILSTTVDDLYIQKAKINSSVMFASKPVTNEFLEDLFNKTN